MRGLKGREIESRLVAGWLDDTRAGHGSTVCVTGEAGIGKSTLLDLVEAESRDRGLEVRRVTADELTATRQLAVLAELLDVDVPLAPDGGHASDEVGIAAVGGGTSTPPAETIDALVGSLDTTLVDPAVLIIDDAHWCDRWSVVVLRRLLRVAPSLGRLVFLAFRTDAEHLSGRVEPGELPYAHRIELGRVEAGAARRIAADLLDGEPGPTLRGMIDRTAGHPLYITELVRFVSSRLVRSDDGVEVLDATMPPSLLRAIEERVRAVPDALDDTLATCAVLGDRFSFADASRAFDQPVEALLADLRALEQCALIQLDGDWVSFAHPMYREVAYERIPPTVRREVHGRIADGVAESSPAAAMLHSGLAAVSPDETTAQLLTLFVETQCVNDPETAVGLLRVAVDLSDGVLSGLDRQELLATILVNLGRADESLRVLDSMEEIGEAQPSRRILGALALFLRASHEDARERLKNILDGDLPDDLRAQAAAYHAMARLASGDPAVEESAREAIELCREHPQEEAVAQVCLGRALAYRHAYEVGLEHTGRAIELADGTMQRSGHRFAPWFFHGITLLDLDRHAEVAAAAVSGRQRSTTVRSNFAEPLYDGMMASLAYRQGNGDFAYAQALAAADASEDLGALQGVVWCLSLGALTELDRGDAAAASRLLERADGHFASGRSLLGIDHYFLAHARILEEAGKHDEARLSLHAAWELFKELEIYNCLPVLGPTIARLDLTEGSGSATRMVAKEAEARWKGCGAPGIEALAVWCRALSIGDADSLAGVREELMRLRRVTDGVDVLLDEILVRVRIGDETEARRLLGELDAADAQYRGRVARLARDLQKVGFRMTEPSIEARGPGALTDSEEHVVRLVAAGSTNAEVAAERGVSIRTVESQLYRVYQKLGVSNRAQLVRLVMLEDQES